MSPTGNPTYSSARLAKVSAASDQYQRISPSDVQSSR